MGDNTPEEDLENTEKVKLNVSQWYSLFAALPVSFTSMLIRTLYVSSYTAFFNTDKVSAFFTLGVHGGPRESESKQVSSGHSMR